MRFKNDNDNRYKVNFMRDTEELINKLSISEFISYLKENAVLEDYTSCYIDNEGITCKVYDLKEKNSKLHKEFLVTENDRLFYWRTPLDKIELCD